MRHGGLIVFVLVLTALGLSPGVAIACGFPDSFNKLRKSMEDVAAFHDLQLNRRLGTLQARLRAVDEAELYRTVRDIGLEHRINEVQRLLSMARGVASGMGKVDKGALETLLRRVSRMETSACHWTRQLPGLSRPGSEGRAILFASLLMLLTWALLRLRPEILRLWHQSTLCRIPAVLRLGAKQLDVELVELSRRGCRAVPEHADLAAWKTLLDAKAMMVIEVGTLHLPCTPVQTDEAALSFDFATPASKQVFDRLLSASQTQPRRLIPGLT